MSLYAKQDKSSIIKELSKYFISWFLEEFWQELSHIQPYKLWSGGFLYGFFFEKSLYDASNLNKFLDNWFKGRSPKQHINLGVTNILTGKGSF